MHELRRPLQALALLDGEGAVAPAGSAPGAPRRGLLELARGALAELDAAVNGSSPQPIWREVSCRELVLATLERWRPAASEAGGIKLFWDAGPATLVCDPVRISQALDNLISNALEHGGPPLVITGASVAGRLRITVTNGVETGAVTGNGGDPRKGHGVSVVSDVAADHRGRFAICRTGSGCVAALEFPLTDRGLAQAA